MTRTSAPHTAVRLLAATLALAFAASGLAQGFPGTYQAPVPQGVVTVQLTMQGERLFGQLEGPGVRFDLEGWVEDGVGVGVASSAQGALGFEAVVEGDTLGLWFYEVVNGAVVPDSEIEVILTRVAERSEEHTSELQSRPHLVCRLLLEKKNATLTQN